MHAIHSVTTPEQIAATAELAAVIWNEHFPAIIGQAQVDYMVENLQSAPAMADQIDHGACYYLLTVDKQRAGYLALVHDESARRLMISKIYLRASTRGQGLGKVMLDFAIDQAKRLGCATVWLTVNRGNANTIDWYYRRGFEVTEEVNKDIGSGFVMEDYVMELPVG